MIFNFVLKMLKIVNWFIPKNKNLVIFHSFPDFMDNSMALFNFMKNMEGFELVWIVDEPFENGIKQYKRRSLKSIWKILRASTIISNHRYLMELRIPRQNYVDLWHGMPLKAVGYTKSTPYMISPRPNDNNYYLIATSITMRNALAACFWQDPRRIFITGQPRNDKLFRKPMDLSEILGVDIKSYSKVVLFAPTFRKTAHFIGPDGNLDVNGEMISYRLNLPDFQKDEFSDFIEKNNILFLVKFHPTEEIFAREFFSEMDNVLLITNEMLQKHMIDIYDILGAVDVLVTDYSSIYFDFLLLDRPIIFVVPDLEEYRRFRGFVLEPFEFWTPGPKVKTFREFLDELEKSLNDPEYYASERKTINELVNHYKDDKSSERVYRLVFHGESEG